jgi:hypothetical protein
VKSRKAGRQPDGCACVNFVAIPQLPHPEATAIELHFPQENTALRDAGMGT